MTTLFKPVARIEFQENGSLHEIKADYKIKVELIMEDKRINIGSYCDISLETIKSMAKSIGKGLNSLNYRGDVLIDPRASSTRMLSSELMAPLLRTQLASRYQGGAVDINNTFLEEKR